MHAEIIASGTELLMGETQDTNSSYLGTRLPALGLELQQVSLVGDDPVRYCEILERSFRRNAFTFTSGGLGPTQDDVTRESIAAVLEEEVYIDKDQEQWLVNLFQSRGQEMPPRNIKQAWLIPSAVAITNRMGTAPGWWVEKDGHVIVALPGPPRELHDMWEREIEPRIREKVRGNVILTKTIKTIGLSEALVDELATPVLGIENPYVGTYAKPDGIHLRIIARGPTREDAHELIEPVFHRLKGIFGDNVWGIDDESAEESIASLLLEKGLTVATMESCTGGLLANILTNVNGSSAYFKGGIISYTNELKVDSGVPAELIENYGVVSEQVAEFMARAVRERLGSDLGVGITGVAGPEPLENQPPGVVYIGVAHPKGSHASYYRFPANNRSLVKHRAVISALLDVRRILMAHEMEEWAP